MRIKMRERKRERKKQKGLGVCELREMRTIKHNKTRKTAKFERKKGAINTNYGND